MDDALKTNPTAPSDMPRTKALATRSISCEVRTSAPAEHAFSPRGRSLNASHTGSSTARSAMCGRAA
jgi:hypothetical protein